MIEKLNFILKQIMEGHIDWALSGENIVLVSQEAKRLLDKKEPLDKMEADIANLIISISNLVYNNSDREILFLSDGVYDLLVELSKRYNAEVPVGATPIVFYDDKGDLVNDKKNQQFVNPIVKLDDEFALNSFYYENIFKVQPKFDINFYNRVTDRNSGRVQRKKNVNIPHKYPNLVGTLDKCKFTLNKQARDAGVFDDPSVKIFERDFLGKQLQEGLFTTEDNLILIAELKYDGISVEADVCDHIISARSRGDANNDIAADLTPVLGGMRFPFCPDIGEEESFGMQFEAIMTYHNLERYSRLRGRPYKNSRNTMTGLFGSIDAYDFRDLITLVPLKTSLDIDPLTEIEFMNKYYQNGEIMRYSVLVGKYYDILYQVMTFVEEAAIMRPALPFMYDGIVIHHTDPKIKEALGRKNATNQFSIAIKFASMKEKAIFTGYDYTVGQNGVITPMIHYTPVEFIGTIHDKSSGHSYARFKDLNLAIGDVVDVEYRNDVMPYVTKAEQPYQNMNSPVEFIHNCPSCGAEILFTEKSALCPNPHCPEKVLTKMVNMMKKLNLKDFAEASVGLLGIKSFKNFMELTPDRVAILGPTNAENILKNIEYIKTSPINDYNIIGAIGFDNVAIETWRKVLSIVPLNDIIEEPESFLYSKLVGINGIGPITAGTILSQREDYIEDLEYIVHMPNLISSFGNIENKVKIRFSGIRDSELVRKLNEIGCIAGEGSVTKDTSYLVVPYDGYMSDKVTKAMSYGIPVVPIDQFYIDWESELGGGSML